MWGIIPAAGAGSRIQPLAFSKELLPVGSRSEAGIERPRAVSEYLVERMILGGATKLCFVISPGKSDILEYYGASVGSTPLAFVVQPTTSGLCDAIFRALPLVTPRDEILIGLPDTIWFPANGFAELCEGAASFLLFEVDQPQFFDAVVTDDQGRVLRIEVKQLNAATRWIWGAIKLPGAVLYDLHTLWQSRGCRDEYLGTLVNAWIDVGGEAWGVPAGRGYVDVGTLDGYREAVALLSSERPDDWETAPPQRYSSRT